MPDVPFDDPASEGSAPGRSGPDLVGPDRSAPDPVGPNPVGSDRVGVDPEALRLAADPATDPAALAHLAYEVPETRALVAANPTTYPELLVWLEQFEDSAVQTALAARRTGSGPTGGGVGTGDVGSGGVGPGGVHGAPADHRPVPGDASSAPSPTPTTVRLFGRDLPRRTVQIAAGVTAGAVLLGIVSGVAIGLGGGASSSSSDVDAAGGEDAVAVVGPSDEASTPADDPTPEETPSAPAAAALGRTWTTTMSRDGGYTEDVSVAFGDPEHFGTTHPEDPGLTGGALCGGDPATDAVVPFELSVTSSTEGFGTQVGANLQFQVASDSPMAAEGLRIEGAYSSEGSCTGPTGYSNTITSMGLQSTATDLESGRGVVLDGWLVLHGYYSPAAPDGDAALLDEVSFAFGSSTTDNSGVWDRNGADVRIDRGDGQDPTTSDQYRWTLTGEGSAF